MANNQAPFGFQFVRNYYSAAPTYQTSVYQIAYNNSNSFGKGDVVKGLNTGYIDRAITSDQVILGIIDRVEYFDSTLQAKQFRNAWLAPSSALQGSCIAYVIDDPNAVFQAQAGGSTTAIGQADINANINFGGNAAPNTRTGLSVAYLDQTTINTTATLPFRLVNVPQNAGNGAPLTAGPIGNDSTSAYNIAEVLLNTSAITTRTGI